jgi:glycosyltransferase involved in cell wall biosynthesis
MKVMHLHFGKEGGAERFFVNLVNELGRRAVEQRFVIRPGRSWTSQISGLGPVIENDYRRISPTSYLLQWRVARMCRVWQPDAIMAWMPRAARLIPKHEAAVKLTRLGDFPRHLQHFIRCDVLVGNTPDIGVHCQKLGWAKPMLTISNFPRPVTPIPVSRAEHQTPDDAFLICGAGRFVPRKGMDLLVRATAKIPGAWLWLIGDGVERPKLENLVAELGIADRTRFVGWVAEPIHHLAAANVVGMPSRHEPLGNVVLEGWQAGVPVVSTRSEGPSWFMRDGVNGLLTQIDDLDAFVAALQKVRADKALAARLADGARQTLATKFSIDGIVNQYLDLFSGNLGGGVV